MIHHLLFSDTLILDAMFPIYLIWDSVFGFNFYQPYIKPLPISLRTDEFPWGMLIFYTYGYLMSFAFTVYLPLVLVGDTLKGKLNKKIFFSNIWLLFIYLALIEVFLIYFSTWLLIYEFLANVFPSGYGALASVVGLFLLAPLIVLFSLPILLFAWLYGLYLRRSSKSP
jgi:hypothetical protein